MVDDGIPVRLTEQGLVYVERTAYLSRIHLKLHEAAAMFLACRLLARHSDKPNQHTVIALEKLGAALQAKLPQIGQHVADTSAALRRCCCKGVLRMDAPANRLQLRPHTPRIRHCDADLDAMTLQIRPR